MLVGRGLVLLDGGSIFFYWLCWQRELGGVCFNDDLTPFSTLAFLYLASYLLKKLLREFARFHGCGGLGFVRRVRIWNISFARVGLLS